MLESVNSRKDALMDRHRLESHPINSPCEPSARLSLNVVQEGLKYISVITLCPL